MTGQEKDFEPTVNPATATVQEMFGKVLQDRIQSGAVEQAIIKHVDKLIESAADDVFRSYGDVGKALKEQFAKAIMPQLESIGDLPTYHEYVTNRLKLATQNFYDNRLASVVDAELKDLLAEVPEEITLSWLVKHLVKQCESDSDGGYEGEITLIMRKMWDWCDSSYAVFLDPNPNVSERDCDYDLHLSKNKESGKWDLLGVRVDGRKPGEKICMGRLYNFDKVLFNIFAMKGSIDLDKGLDAEDYETSWRRD